MSKKKRSRRGKADDSDRSQRSAAPGWWNDLEQAFFASAPPDEPPPPAEPLRFDDLSQVTPPRRHGRLMNQHLIAIVLASVTLLIVLTAVVFASHR